MGDYDELLKALEEKKNSSNKPKDTSKKKDLGDILSKYDNPEYKNNSNKNIEQDNSSIANENYQPEITDRASAFKIKSTLSDRALGESLRPETHTVINKKSEYIAPTDSGIVNPNILGEPYGKNNKPVISSFTPQDLVSLRKNEVYAPDRQSGLIGSIDEGRYKSATAKATEQVLPDTASGKMVHQKLQENWQPQNFTEEVGEIIGQTIADTPLMAMGGAVVKAGMPVAKALPEVAEVVIPKVHKVLDAMALASGSWSLPPALRKLAEIKEELGGKVTGMDVVNPLIENIKGNKNKDIPNPLVDVAKVMGKEALKGSAMSLAGIPAGKLGEGISSVPAKIIEKGIALPMEGTAMELVNSAVEGTAPTLKGIALNTVSAAGLGASHILSDIKESAVNKPNRQHIVSDNKPIIENLNDFYNAKQSDAVRDVLSVYKSPHTAMDRLDYMNEQSKGKLFPTPEHREEFFSQLKEYDKQQKENNTPVETLPINDFKVEPLQKNENLANEDFNNYHQVKTKLNYEFANPKSDKEQLQVLDEIINLSKTELERPKEWNAENTPSGKNIQKYFKSKEEIEYYKNKANDIKIQGNNLGLTSAETESVMRTLLLNKEMEKEIATRVNFYDDNNYANILFDKIGTQNLHMKHAIGENFSDKYYRVVDILKNVTLREKLKLEEIHKKYRDVLSEDQLKAVNILQMYGQENTRKHLESTLGKEELKQYHDAVKVWDNFTQEQKDYAEGRYGWYKRIKDLIDMTLKITDSEPIGNIDYYTPVSIKKLEDITTAGKDPFSGDGRDYMLGKISAEEYMRNNPSVKFENATHTKERKDGGTEVELNPFIIDEKYAKLMLSRAIEYPLYKKMYSIANEIGKKQPAISKIIKDNVNYTSGQYYDPTPYSRQIKGFAKGWTKVMLYLRASTAVIQLASTIPTMAIHPVKFWSAAKDLMINEQIRNDIMNTASIHNRIMDVTLNEMEKSKYSLVRKLDHVAESLIKVPDMMSAAIAYKAHFDDILKQTGNEEYAKTKASEFVKETQGSGAAEDHPKILRNALGKGLSPFMTFALSKFHYMYGHLLGLQPTYTFTNSFKDKSDAIKYAKSAGHMMKELKDGTFATYDKRQMSEFVKGMSTFGLIVAGDGIFNAMTGMIKAGTGIPINAGSTDAINAYYKQLYGQSWQDDLIGNSRKGSNLTEDEQNYRAYMAFLFALAEGEIPYAGKLVSSNPYGALGGLIGMIGQSSKNISSGIMMERPELIAKGVWDATSLIGNKAVPIGDQIWNYLMDGVNDEKRYISEQRKLNKNFMPDKSEFLQFLERNETERKELLRMEREAKGGGSSKGYKSSYGSGSKGYKTHY